MNRSSLILPRTQHKVVLLVVLTMFARRFLITLFLAIKLQVGISFQIGDSLSALYLYSCVKFLLMCQLSILRLNLTSIFAASSTDTIAFRLADLKLESSEAYLLKVGKNLWWDFEVICIFSKNVVLNICRYLKGFYTSIIVY